MATEAPSELDVWALLHMLPIAVGSRRGTTQAIGARAVDREQHTEQRGNTMIGRPFNRSPSEEEEPILYLPKLTNGQ